ncbi:MAG: metalloregulator ArsR/SmtB family transcription factor [Planctomycetota bacterium]
MMKKAVNILKALANPTRLRIMHILIAAKHELCICEIMDSLRLPQYHISKHIRELKIAGLVEEREEGRFVFYTLISDKNKLRQLLLKALAEIDDATLADDKKRMTKRLSLRVNDKCVIGLTKREK